MKRFIPLALALAIISISLVNVVMAGEVADFRMSNSCCGPAISQFPSGTNTVYVVFDYEYMDHEPLAIVVKGPGPDNIAYYDNRDSPRIYTGAGTECISIPGPFPDVPPHNPYITQIWHKINGGWYLADSFGWSVSAAITPTPTPTPVATGDYITIEPPNPTNNDEVLITTFGEWRDSCVPEYVSHSIFRNVITIDAIAGAPPGWACMPVISFWDFTVSLGKLSPGTHTIKIYICDQDLNTSMFYDTTTFDVTALYRVYLPVILKHGDTYEPNDSPVQAYGPLASGATYRSYIWTADDDDWYYIDITTLALIIIDLDVPVVADYDLYLYDSTGTNIVAKSDNYGNGINEHIEYTLKQTGKYYIRVYPYQGYSKIEPYLLIAALGSP